MEVIAQDENSVDHQSYYTDSDTMGKQQGCFSDQ